MNFQQFRMVSRARSTCRGLRTMCFRPDRLIAKSWCGTGPFLSPEALLGDVSPAADMWAPRLHLLGFTGFTPHSGSKALGMRMIFMVSILHLISAEAGRFQRQAGHS